MKTNAQIGEYVEPIKVAVILFYHTHYIYILDTNFIIDIYPEKKLKDFYGCQNIEN